MQRYATMWNDGCQTPSASQRAGVYIVWCDIVMVGEYGVGSGRRCCFFRFTVVNIITETHLRVIGCSTGATAH